MIYTIITQCLCGEGEKKEVTKEEFDKESDFVLYPTITVVEGENTTMKYQTYSCKVCHNDLDSVHI